MTREMRERVEQREILAPFSLSIAAISGPPNGTSRCANRCHGRVSSVRDQVEALGGHLRLVADGVGRVRSSGQASGVDAEDVGKLGLGDRLLPGRPSLRSPGLATPSLWLEPDDSHLTVARTLIEGDTSIRAGLVCRRLDRMAGLSYEIGALTRQITAAVNTVTTSLVGLYGIGRLGAARFIAEVVDINRYPTKSAFASANGTAPIPASSGRTVRHRLNRGGNRQLNRVLYTMAITQIRADTPGRTYYQRKRAEGKTSREAIRCLKRRLSDVVYTTMRTDAAAASEQTMPVAA